MNLGIAFITLCPSQNDKLMALNPNAIQIYRKIQSFPS